jgi:hypothetical protein
MKKKKRQKPELDYDKKPSETLEKMGVAIEYIRISRQKSQVSRQMKHDVKV